MQWRSISLGLVLLGGLAAIAQRAPYPKPQVADMERAMAPDFALKDQAGKEFRLSAMRGQAVLIYFYRGYW